MRGSQILIYGMSLQSICLNGPKCRYKSNCPYNHPKWGYYICLYNLKSPGSCRFSRNCKNGDHVIWSHIMHHQMVTQRRSQQLFPKRRPRNDVDDQQQKLSKIEGLLPNDLCRFKQKCKFKGSCKNKHPKWAQFYCIYNFKKECMNRSTNCKCGIHKDWNTLAKQINQCEKQDREEIKSISKQECIICLYPMDMKLTTKTSCKHQFHTDCLEKWKTEKNSCPICRKSFNEARSISIVRVQRLRMYQ